MMNTSTYSSPSQLCYRYRVGVIDRDELIRSLSAYNYQMDDFAEVVDALDNATQ